MENQVNAMPRIGDLAPEFKAVTTQGEINFPSDYTGKWKILFSHPADFTPVCTSEFMTFASMQADFEKLSGQVAHGRRGKRPALLRLVLLHQTNQQGTSGGEARQVSRALRTRPPVLPFSRISIRETRTLPCIRIFGCTGVSAFAMREKGLHKRKKTIVLSQNSRN